MSNAVYDKLLAKNPGAGTLRGYRLINADGEIGSEVAVYCDHCGLYHFHGYTGDYFHRCNHCGDDRSPYAKVGYIVHIEGAIHRSEVERNNHPPMNFLPTPNEDFNMMATCIEDMCDTRTVQVFNPYDPKFGISDSDQSPLWYGYIHIDKHYPAARLMNPEFAVFEYVQAEKTVLLLVWNPFHFKAGLLAMASNSFWTRCFGIEWAKNNAECVETYMWDEYRKVPGRYDGLMPDFKLPLRGIPHTYFRFEEPKIAIFFDDPYE